MRESSMYWSSGEGARPAERTSAPRVPRGAHLVDPPRRRSRPILSSASSPEGSRAGADLGPTPCSAHKRMSEALPSHWDRRAPMRTKRSPPLAPVQQRNAGNHVRSSRSERIQMPHPRHAPLPLGPLASSTAVGRYQGRTGKTVTIASPGSARPLPFRSL